MKIPCCIAALQVLSCILHSCILIFHMQFNNSVFICILPQIPTYSFSREFSTMFRAQSILALHLIKISSHCLVYFTDIGWVGCPDTRRSTSGYCIYLDDNIISWSKWKPTLSFSSAKTEYHSVTNVVAETCWIQNLLLELRRIHKAILVYCDNVSAIYLSANHIQHLSH